ncbi:MAG TPA: cytochrome P450 [Acidimicrobiia bacterium]|nr:cytochrome P450 [Acidimicrobiia bacterium]
MPGPQDGGTAMEPSAPEQTDTEQAEKTFRDLVGSDGMAAFDPERQANPHPVLAELRTQAPLIDTGTGFAQVIGRAGCEAVFRNHDPFSSKFPPIGGAHRPLIPIQLDPPEHKQFRKILDPIFAPRTIAPRMEPITELINEHIDRFIDHGECVFDEEVAVPFPSQVFLTVAGLPLSDLEYLIELKDGILRPGYREGLANDDIEGRDAINAATVVKIYEYFQAAIDERRAHPTGDMLSNMLTSEVDGERLTDEEILDTCFLFLIAGLDTVTDSLTLFFVHLAQSDERRRQIVADPEIIPNAVEELLRYETPVQGVFRIAAADGDVVGCPVGAGTFLSVNLGSANTDPAFLPDADVVRFDRDVNPHYAFGGGVHRCLGSHLARQELRIVLREWHRRIPEYRIKPGTELIWPPGLRSVENIVLEWPT